MRMTVHVRPRSARTRVGGDHGGALVVRVREPAVDGRANDAVLRALAEEMHVPRNAVTVVSGSRSRHKIVDVDGNEAELARVVARLREMT